MLLQTPPLANDITAEQGQKWDQWFEAFLNRNGLHNRDAFQQFIGYPHLGNQMDAIARKASKKAGQQAPPVATIELTDSQKEAKAIMGKNFFGTQEAATHFGAKWTQEQLDALATIPFSDEVLEASKDTHVLVAGYPMSLIQVRSKANKAKKGKLFYTPSGGWYDTQAFATKTKVEVRWYLIRKKPVDNSTSKSWDEQQALLKDESTPTACVMTYAIIGHFLNTGERLFENIYVRCSDIASDGDRVYVGYFDASGLGVLRVWDDYRLSSLGLSASRNF